MSAWTDPCAWCGRPIPDTFKPGRRRTYCRTSCRNAAYRDRKKQVRRMHLDAARLQDHARSLREIIDRQDLDTLGDVPSRLLRASGFLVDEEAQP